MPCRFYANADPTDSNADGDSDATADGNSNTAPYSDTDTPSDRDFNSASPDRTTNTAADFYAACSYLHLLDPYSY